MIIEEPDMTPDAEQALITLWPARVRHEEEA